jgi:DNA-binding NarL/FixJ family response regulator
VTPKIRVLVVDDDPMQLELVQRALSYDGFDVRGVLTTGEMAREGPQFLPHLMLIDVNMPDAPPDQAVAVARDVATGCRVVLYSAWEDSRLRALSLRIGADGYISKSESVIGIGRRLRDLYKG